MEKKISVATRDTPADEKNQVFGLTEETPKSLYSSIFKGISLFFTKEIPNKRRQKKVADSYLSPPVWS
jgi:hypothetical protein